MGEQAVHPEKWCGKHTVSTKIKNPKCQYNYGVKDENTERSSMCLISEMSRFNNLRYEYILLDESGPAHKKQFSVKLSFSNNEAYIGCGASIKKAQQSAAKNALENTTLPRPITKQSKKDPTNYFKLLTSVGKCLQKQAFINACDNDSMLGSQNLLPFPLITTSRFNSKSYSPLTNGSQTKKYSVEVKIGDALTFHGHGNTLKEAKNNASCFALTYLSPILVEKNKELDRRLSGNNTTEEENSTTMLKKNVISIIHEYAVKMKMNVEFNLLSETGEPHNRIYNYECRVTSEDESFSSEGEGNSKKSAKTDACEKMVKILETYMEKPIFIATYFVSISKKMLPNPYKEQNKRRLLVKDRKMDPEYGHHINPISRLIQVVQMTKEPDPVFNFIDEKNVFRRREFICEVTWKNFRCEGCGPTKKLSKRAAAEALLEMIGYSKPMKKPGKSLLKNKNEDKMDCQIDSFDFTKLNIESKNNVEVMVENEKKKKSVSFNPTIYGCGPPDEEDYPKIEIVPLKDGSSKKYKKVGKNRCRMLNYDDCFKLANLSKEYLVLSQEERKEKPYEYLEFLSKQYRFKINVTEFPKRFDDDQKKWFYFVLINLNLENTVVCNGSGNSDSEAIDNAAKNILELLKDIHRKSSDYVVEETFPSPLSEDNNIL
uniref:DRBM domain-containing protein n=1 Tax=Parastrongyloides trichosuri TaxID=131310 RepID=A0A0N4ZYA9_PARTI